MYLIIKKSVRRTHSVLSVSKATFILSIVSIAFIPTCSHKTQTTLRQHDQPVDE